ncbi:hypothetical protein [Streptomyces griseorubiginosus]|uniref:hypothetical protein n=1 Tax=Streptomyces griseorubiginosus TaxID=67304 RepID=UPI002E7FB8DD|nr:hypothetical protein [Streptomyces griseorubiginosus]
MPDLPERESGRKPSRQRPRRTRGSGEPGQPRDPSGPQEPRGPQDARGRRDPGPRDPSGPRDSGETDAERRRRRAQFLRDLAEARELRDRVQPRRAKVARLRHAMRMRTFRW